jgi:hypothetical protein
VNSENSGSDKINANLVRLGVVVGVLFQPQFFLSFGQRFRISILTVMKRKLSAQEPASKHKKRNVESPKNFWFQMLKELKQLGYKSDLPNRHRA